MDRKPVIVREGSGRYFMAAQKRSASRRAKVVSSAFLIIFSLAVFF
jgi:hypothetical protein